MLNDGGEKLDDLGVAKPGEVDRGAGEEEVPGQNGDLSGRGEMDGGRRGRQLWAVIDRTRAVDSSNTQTLQTPDDDRGELFPRQTHKNEWLVNNTGKKTGGSGRSNNNKKKGKRQSLQRR